VGGPKPANRERRYDGAVRKPPDIKHPYVTKRPGVCGGEPIIRGTRFPVRSVVEYVLRQGMTPEAVVREWDHLTLAQIYDALSYFHDHRAEVLGHIRRHRNAFRRRRMTA
jgi:uncharacterized protein (DUF433 family)